MRTYLLSSIFSTIIINSINSIAIDRRMLVIILFSRTITS